MSKQDKKIKGGSKSEKYTICNDCVFCSIKDEDKECIHPLEFGIDCSRVVFCSSFQPLQQVDSPCVTFGDEE